MALNFDIPPLNDPLTKEKELHLSGTWSSWLSSFYMTLISYLTQYGMFVPRLTIAQRDEIQTPVNGQLIYNTTTNTFQGYEAGSWKTFTLI